MLYYAQWYKQIYDMLPNDQPPQDVIDDDEAIDNWYTGYLRDIARKVARQGRAGAGDRSGPKEWKNASDIAFAQNNTYRSEKT